MTTGAAYLIKSVGLLPARGQRPHPYPAGTGRLQIAAYFEVFLARLPRSSGYSARRLADGTEGVGRLQIVGTGGLDGIDELGRHPLDGLDARLLPRQMARQLGQDTGLGTGGQMGDDPLRLQEIDNLHLGCSAVVPEGSGAGP